MQQILKVKAWKGRTFIFDERHIEKYQSIRITPVQPRDESAARLLTVDVELKSYVGAVSRQRMLPLIWKYIYDTDFEREVYAATAMQFLGFKIRKPRPAPYKPVSLEARYYLSSTHGYGWHAMQDIRDSILSNVVSKFTRVIQAKVPFRSVEWDLFIRQEPWCLTIGGRLSEGQKESLRILRETNGSSYRQACLLAA